MKIKEIPKHEIERFIFLVEKMRKEQIAYYGGGNIEKLKLAKKYEQGVDNWLNKYIHNNKKTLKNEKRTIQKT